ncbi:Acetyltransf_3 domain-containing protein [Cinnamomum micranthum f. kanehirae]|uniref:Acetyltransf_3 domain-containing protein n=1 Tax=Cinnamomum micranthum f. kanehirae TaxID=337451 RepID=A0A3S3NS22_9MAGN|nr:Acetyltransf_3 domain-containing protein [Cinnamomum micranthum f. kanehirae]
MESVTPERLSLRPFERSDADDLMMFMGDDRVARFCRFDTLTCREDGVKYLEEVAMPHPWYRAICLEGRAVGYIYVKMGTEENHCRGEIGYALAFKYWGQGIATLAVKMVMSSVFREFPHLVRLEALVDVENKGSQRVLDKCGFLREGLLRKYCFLKGKTMDVFIYSVLSTDPILLS